MKYLLILLITLLLYSCENQSESLFIKGKDVLIKQGYTNIVQTNENTKGYCGNRTKVNFTAINNKTTINGCFCGVGDEIIINFY